MFLLEKHFSCQKKNGMLTRVNIDQLLAYKLFKILTGCITSMISKSIYNNNIMTKEPKGVRKEKEDAKILPSSTHTICQIDPRENSQVHELKEGSNVYGKRK